MTAAPWVLLSKQPAAGALVDRPEDGGNAPFADY
jgi:hypothetical protein